MSELCPIIDESSQVQKYKNITATIPNPRTDPSLTPSFSIDNIPSRPNTSSHIISNMRPNHIAGPVPSSVPSSVMTSKPIYYPSSVPSTMPSMAAISNVLKVSP